MTGYGWLGGRERATPAGTFGLTLMGARLYNPVTAPFTTTDPVYGGNANTYTYLMNGTTSLGNWTGLFRSGEKVRLRFINGSAMTYFDVRIPGLKMTVVAVDGQYVHPVSVDEFRIAVAETFDVIVEPSGQDAYTLYAQDMGRTGHARGHHRAQAHRAAAEDDDVGQHVGGERRGHVRCGQRGRHRVAGAHQAVDHPGLAPDLGHRPAGQHGDEAQRHHQPRQLQEGR